MTRKFNIIKENFIKVYTKEIECDIPVEKIYIHNVDQVTHYIYNIDDIIEPPINNNIIFKNRFVNLPIKKTVYIDKHFRFSRWNCDCIMYPFSKESEHLVDNFQNNDRLQYDTYIHFFTNEPGANMYFLKANIIVLFEICEGKTNLCYYISKKMYEAGIMNRKVNNKTSYLMDLLENDAIEKRNKKAEEALMVILNEPSKNKVDKVDEVLISELKDSIQLYNYQKADIKWMTDIKETIDRNKNVLSLNYTDYHKVILREPYSNEPKEYILFEGKLVNATIENKTMNINYIGGNIISEIGTGKCHKKDTLILMFDGSIKKVQDIKKGELLMGDNSKARKVLSLARGQDIMYDIIPVKGEKYTVNQEHILCLKVSGKPTINITKGKYKSYNIRWVENNKYNSKNFPINKEIEAKEFFKNVKHQDIIEIAVKDYIKLPQNIKNLLKGYKVPIDFCEKELPLDAYMIGFWLGDGSSNGTEITNQDSTVIKYFKTNLQQYKCYLQYDNKYKYRINGDGSGKENSNKFLNTLKNLDLLNNKHIPLIYKCNSRENRLKLLAGLLDSDGSLCNDNCTFDFVQKSKKLIDDVIYLARSLGFACYKSKQKKGCWYLGEYKEDTYYRICISGNTEDIPVLCPRKKANERKQKKDVLKTGITVKEVGYDDYYGFEIDGNRRYLMGDFTVTHNTLISLGYLIKNFTNEYDSFISFENTLCNYFYKRGKNKGKSCEKKKIDELYCKEHSKTIFIDKRKTIFNKIEIDKSFSLRDQIIEIGEHWNKKKLFKSNASLILCPNQLCDQWVREYYEKFKQSEVSKRILLIVTYDQYRNITFGELLFADIIIVSYDFLKNTNYLKRGNINRWNSRQNITEVLDDIDNELNVELNEKLSENGNDSETEQAELDLSVTRILDKFNVKLNILDNFYYQNIIFDECFPGNQNICTDNGKMTIYKIYTLFKDKKKLPLVKTFNEITKEFEYKKILNAWEKIRKEKVILKLSRRKLECTPNHKLLSTSGWKMASQFKIGELILCNYDDKSEQSDVAKIFNEDQYQIMLGSFLGDGNISKTQGNRYRLRIIHGIKQKEYCEWKAKMFKVDTSIIEKNGYSQKQAITFCTKVFDIELKEIPKNKYTCPQWILNELDVKGLAIWFMDDGNMNNNTFQAKISTDSFDEDSQKRIVKMLKDKFNIESFYSKYKKEYFQIVLDCINSQKLIELIYPYIHKNLLYKIMPKKLIEYIDDQNKTINDVFNNKYNIRKELLKQDFSYKALYNKKVFTYKWKYCEKCNTDNFWFDSKKWKCQNCHSKNELCKKSDISIKFNEFYNWNNEYKTYGTIKINNITNIENDKKVYDIEVEDNHNFICCTSTTNYGIIAHNCHEIKDGVFNDTLKSFHSKYRWNITATPFANGLNSFVNSIRNITNKNFDYIDDKIDVNIIKLFSKLYRRNTKESIKEEYTQTEITDTLKLLKFTEQERRIYDAHSLNKSNSTKDFLIKLCCDTSIDIETKNLVKNCKTLDEIEAVILNHNKKKLQGLKKIIDEYTNKITKLEEQVNIGFVPVAGFNFENTIILTMEDLRTMLGNVRRTLTVNKKEYNEINRTYTFLKNAVENIKISETCPICLDNVDDVAITKCGHKFCKDCIHEYVEEMGKRGDTKCPKCNIPIKIDEIYLLKETKELELIVNEDNNELSNVISRVKSTKIGNIIYFIKNCLKETDKCIIFSQWDPLLTKVGKLLKAENIPPLFCSGTIYQRKRSIKAFQEDPKSRIICLSSENCASGINLTAANKIIFIEPVYGSINRRKDIENQAIGRSVRLGNTKPVEVIRFIIKDTIEEDIYNDNEKELNYKIVDTEPLELNGNILEI
jgi:hypothetical protein